MTNLAELLVHQGLPRMPELQGKIHAKKTWGGLAFRHLVAVATSTIYLKGETKHAPPRPQHPFILHPPLFLGIGKPQNAAIKGAYAVSDTESIEVLGNVWRMPCMLGRYLNKTGVKEKSFKQTK